jgi:MFS family permease
MRALLRSREFRLLWAGQTLSAFGDYAMFLAMGVWAKELTGSNAIAGLTALPFALPALLGPALGVVVDRFPRRHVMIATDLAAGVAMLMLFFVHHRSDLWILYAVALAYGTAVTIYEGARSGLLVGMLPEEQLGDANGLLHASNQAMRLGAPLAGAALFALLGGHAVATVDAVTFFVSAGLLTAVRTRDLERRGDAVHLWREIREGIAHIWGTADLRRLTVGLAMLTLLLGVSEVAIYAVIDQGLHRPPAFLGVILSVQGLGSIGAGVAAGFVLRRLGDLRSIAIAAFAAAMAIGLFGTAILPLVFLGAIGGGVANTLFNVAYATIMQTRTSLELQGRVMTAVEAIATAPFLLSLAFGALLISRVSFRVVYGTEALGILALTGFFAWMARDADRSRAVEPAATDDVAYAADSIEAS